MQAWIGLDWWSKEWKAGKEGRGGVRPGAVRQVRRGMVRSGLVRRGRQGEAGNGKARTGRLRQAIFNRREA